MPFDISDPGACAVMFIGRRSLGGLHILVNNAAAGWARCGWILYPDRAIEDTTWRRGSISSPSLSGAFFLAKAASDLPQAALGRIVQRDTQLFTMLNRAFRLTGAKAGLRHGRGLAGG